MHCSRRLTVQTLVFSRSYLQRLVVKGGTTWARNDRRILPENARLPRNNQASFTCLKSTTWDRRLYFPSEGFFSPWKIRRLRSWLNPRTWVPKASTLPVDHRSRQQHLLVRDVILLNLVGDFPEISKFITCTCGIIAGSFCCLRMDHREVMMERGYKNVTFKFNGVVWWTASP